MSAKKIIKKNEGEKAETRSSEAESLHDEPISYDEVRREMWDDEGGNQQLRKKKQ